MFHAAKTYANHTSQRHQSLLRVAGQPGGATAGVRQRPADRYQQLERAPAAFCRAVSLPGLRLPGAGAVGQARPGLRDAPATPPTWRRWSRRWASSGRRYRRPVERRRGGAGLRRRPPGAGRGAGRVGGLRLRRHHPAGQADRLGAGDGRRGQPVALRCGNARGSGAAAFWRATTPRCCPSARRASTCPPPRPPT